MPEINSRIKNKIATKSEWDKSSLVPLDGEMIVYKNTDGSRGIKIGDGENLAKNLTYPQNPQYVAKIGDTMTGPLKFLTTTLPILDLQMNKEGSNVFTLTTNGSIFVGDGSSTGGARVYYCRKVENLGQAILSAVSVGFNPLDNAIWQRTTDYGIKFDVNVAQPIARPSATRQCASFYVGVNGAVVGYSGSTNTALTNDKIYKVLDSNSIKDDPYVKSLEARIAELEARLPVEEEEETEDGI